MEEQQPTILPQFRFSLRTFLVASLVVGVGCAWVGMQLQQKRRHEAVVDEIVKLGGKVDFPNSTYVPAWKKWIFGTYAVTPVGLDLNLTDATDALLSQMQGMDLRVLDLRSTKVTDAGLAQLAGMTSLEKLLLSNTRLTDAGLAHLKDLSHLQTLYVRDTQLTDAGLAQLKGMTGLVTLSLSNTQITDAGLTNLKGLTRLRSLFLRDTHVTHAGVVELQQAIPDCEMNTLGR